MIARSTRQPAVRLRGFTLVEAAISTVVVSVMIAGALTSVAKTGMVRRIANEQQSGHLLAEQLMSEILAKSYWDPSSTVSTSIGPSNAEKATGNRSALDDVDDYHGWLECPPESADGTDLTLRDNWYRRVQVTFVDFSALDTAISTDYGLKRVYVEVGKVRSGGSVSTATDRRPVATLVAVVGRGRGL